MYLLQADYDYKVRFTQMHSGFPMAEDTAMFCDSLHEISGRYAMSH